MTTDSTTPDAGTAAADLTRPDLVTYAIVAIVARCALVIGFAFSLYLAKSDLARTVRTSTVGKTYSDAKVTQTVDGYIKSSILIAIIGSLIVLGVAKFIRDGKGWARWVYVLLVLFPLSPLSDLVRLFGLFEKVPVLVRLLSFLTGLAMLASVVLLFMKPSRAWFASMRPAGAPASPMGSLFRPRPAAPRPGRAAAETADPAPREAASSATRRAPRPKSRKSAEQ